VAEARHWYERAFAVSTPALVTADDHQALHGLASLDSAVKTERLSASNHSLDAVSWHP
jgi:hypothetical protein